MTKVDLNLLEDLISKKEDDTSWDMNRLALSNLMVQLGGSKNVEPDFVSVYGSKFFEKLSLQVPSGVWRISAML